MSRNTSIQEAELSLEGTLRMLPNAATRDDAVLRVLSDESRRRIVALLACRNDLSTLDDLAAAVAARGDDPEDASIDAETRARTELHHRHLPKLADAGLLTYDYETKEIGRSLALGDAGPTAESDSFGSAVSSGD